MIPYYHLNLVNGEGIRVPLIEMKIDKPNSNSKKTIDIDISINGVLGVANSKLLNVYS